MRKNLQHIKIEKSEERNEKLAENQFLTNEGIILKSTYSEQDIENLEHLDFASGFAPNLRGIATTMYIQNPWKTQKNTDFTIDSVEDMNEWINSFSVDEIAVLKTTTDTILPIIAFYIVAAEEQNTNPEQLFGIIQNEILNDLKDSKSYQYAVKTIIGILEYCSKKNLKFNPICISGASIQKTGIAVDKQLAYTLIYGLEMFRTGLAKGMKIDNLASQISFSFGIGMNHFVEIAKIRAARMIWAKLIQQHSPKHPKSLNLRIHSQTAISHFNPQNSLDDVTRMGIEATAAVLGGTQSLHTHSFGENINLSKDATARISRNTQLFLQKETKITKTVDPWAGSFYVESLTNEIVQKTWKIIEEIENRGGMTQAIDSGFVNLEEEAKQLQKMDNHKSIPIHPSRDAHKVQLALDTLADATKIGKGNLIEFAIEAAKNGATFDEIVNNSIY